VFTPTEAELAAARRTLELFERSRGGATSGADGSLVDEALARQARALIARRMIG
jgi:citrate lyase beta subunit